MILRTGKGAGAGAGILRTKALAMGTGGARILSAGILMMEALAGQVLRNQTPMLEWRSGKGLTHGTLS